MEDFKKIAKQLQGNISKLIGMNNDLLQKIRSEAPEKVDEIIRDQKVVMTAIKNKDLESIHELQKKYADNSN
jgi:RPA family protein